MQEILTRAGSFVAIILLGYCLKRIGVFRDEDFSVLSKVVIRITLPAAIVTSFAGKTFDPALLSLVLLGIGCGGLYMLIATLVNIRSPREKKAFEILNLPGYNIGNFSMPFAQSFLGPSGVIATSLFDTGNAFICLGGAFGVASMVKDGTKFSFGRIVKSLSRSVPFITYITMVTLNLIHVSLPAPILEFAQIIANANAFLAMFMIGVGFKLGGEAGQRGQILKILSLRYGVAAVLALIFWFVLPFRIEIRQALVILAFSPFGSAIPAFTAELKGDVGLSSAINSIAIIISILINVVLLSVML